MNNIEKQILENQRRIMDFLLNPYQSITKHDMIISINKTAKLLNPESEEEDCCEMPERFAEQKTGEQDE
jgi:hypothetical protein